MSDADGSASWARRRGASDAVGGASWARRRSASDADGGAFGAWRSAIKVWRSAIGARVGPFRAWRRAIGARVGAVGAWRRAIGARIGAVGAWRRAIGARIEAVGASCRVVGVRRVLIAAWRRAIGTEGGAIVARGGEATVRVLRGFGEGLVGLAYPPRCLGCGERLFEAHTLLCLTCFHSIDRASTREADARLQRLPQARAALDAVSCLWVFDKGGALQAVHQALKYGNRPSYGVTLGEPLGAAYLEAYPDAASVDVVVPIPLHRARQMERGYNQSDMLAKGASAIVGAPVDARLLVRDRPTMTQTALKRSNRWDNLDGAFRVVDPDRVRGRHVLLVDDVLTTGSTAGAAAKSLKEAGARRVDLATVAMVRTL